MDEEHTNDYREPCVQCSEVDWGITEEGQFYCRSCHNVIERTQEFVDSSFFANSQSSTIAKGTKKETKLEHGHEWLVCEGFQFILKHQAEALLALGVCPQFKDEVLCNMWRRYLQKSRQAYAKRPVHAGKFQLAYDSDSAPESLGFLSDSALQSGGDTEEERSSRPGSISGWSSEGATSVCSGSLDAGFYGSAHSRRALFQMTMPMTLALCHLALLWVREALTLADLLRFVAEGHVPYVNAYQGFPEEMKPYGRDIGVFRALSIPAHNLVQKEAHRLAVFLGLPRFPPITPDCLLHPSTLCLRYLMEANLPDELHDWVSRVIEKTGFGAEALLTYDPKDRRRQLRCHDVLAAALIVVAMKLLFKLDDKVEWMLSKKADDKSKENQGNTCFSLQTWYETLHHALELAREREEEEMAKRAWKPRKPLYPSKKFKSVILKRRRVVEELQANFQKLSGSGPGAQPRSPTSFLFRWGEEGTDGPSFRHHTLDHVTQERGGASHLSNPQYWHTALRKCYPGRCSDHFPEVEPTLPRSYVWVLGFFSFLLGVKEGRVHREVCSVERRLIKSRPPAGPGGRRRRTARPDE
ncbi:TATA box-binding protein-associated factor RNA polymerase I subunit B isoform X1 [Anguilla rostrata]|uniref:TATA box-binding protein-associated factor RNA polymerase I subunit B isoform X1 n=1 Tax=Anguilla rostrata TaxID=7938 RepID=UPI0030D44AE0